MKIIKTILLITLFLSLYSASFSQEHEHGSLLKYLEAFKISAYVDAYYGWNTDKSSHIRQFDGMEPVRDEMRLNIAAVSLKYETEKVSLIAKGGKESYLVLLDLYYLLLK